MLPGFAPRRARWRRGPRRKTRRSMCTASASGKRNLLRSQKGEGSPPGLWWRGASSTLNVALGAARRLDRRAALAVIAVDLDRLPHLVHVIGVAARECVGGIAVLGVDHENAADRCLAVVRDQGAGRHHIHVVSFGLIEMNPVRAVEFGARRHPVLLVGGVDHEQHRARRLAARRRPPRRRHCTIRACWPSLVLFCRFDQAGAGCDPRRCPTLDSRSSASIMAAGSAMPLPAMSCALPCATEENRIGLPIVSAAVAFGARSFAAMCPWSCSMTTNASTPGMWNMVSAPSGPLALMPCARAVSIARPMIEIPSRPNRPPSPACGLSPPTAVC